MPRHHVLARLSYYFPVVWMNPALQWRDIGGRLKFPKAHRSSADTPSDLIIYNPPFHLPDFHHPWLVNLSFRQRLRKACSLLRERGCRKLILYLWRSEFAEALKLIPYDLCCYHIDDEYSFSPVELPLDAVEVRLIKESDQVFIHSPALLERKGGINENTMFTPNGVDYLSFATPVPEPSDLSAIPRPRIGYTGWLKKQLDWPLLLALAKEHPQYSFVFVGGLNRSHGIGGMIAELSSRDNVYFLGTKSTQELSVYPQHFDVCIMPYEVNDYTNCIYPMKLHEYLASGSPIVASKIRSLEDFSGVVSQASDRDEWSQAIQQALTANSASHEERMVRQKTAKEHDWDLIVGKIAATLMQRLGIEAELLQKRSAASSSATSS